MGRRCAGGLCTQQRTPSLIMVLLLSNQRDTVASGGRGSHQQRKILDLHVRLREAGLQVFESLVRSPAARGRWGSARYVRADAGEGMQGDRAAERALCVPVGAPVDVVYDGFVEHPVRARSVFRGGALDHVLQATGLPAAEARHLHPSRSAGGSHAAAAAGPDDCRENTRASRRC